ncbi:hypothetical protein EVAR_37639_1 [Eumeta japonica]|uniref:Uncharacterized protein n=1 Tax=Eumeta variegata TaxID=151549 RepID=A0A4C1VM76_EUMVA|nr:hypothetical protein EVAR_37639_1 [Eumeta japonica]
MLEDEGKDDKESKEGSAAPGEQWSCCYRPDVCFSVLRLLKMTMAQGAFSSSNANCGGEEGMVAVVRGLPDATVAVTLLDSLLPNSTREKPNNCHCKQVSDIDCRNSGLNCSHHPGGNYNLSAGVARATDFNKPGTACKSSETDPVPLKPVCVRHSGAQASDGRYVSTYQVDHCGTTPTSPQQFLTEFPPQRLEPETVTYIKSTYPARNSWNGDLKHGTNFITNTYRQNLVTPEQVRSRSCRTHQIEPFARSLRQYPRFTAERSTAILERLMSYTRNKNHLRNVNAPNNKEKYKLKREPSTSLPNLENNGRNPSKNIQTYTRTINQSQEHTEDTGREVYAVEREVRSYVVHKDSHFNTTFDHMRCDEKRGPVGLDQGIFSRDMDVRHLADVTKCIRERIRYFCGEDAQPVETNNIECGPSSFALTDFADNSSLVLTINSSPGAVPHVVPVTLLIFIPVRHTVSTQVPFSTSVPVPALDGAPLSLGTFDSNSAAGGYDQSE